MGGPARRPPAAILTGPAGIGKTALWERTLERASSLGYLVLAARAEDIFASEPRQASRARGSGRRWPAWIRRLRTRRVRT